MTKVLLVCGPWGGGTTAVAGLLHHMGAIGFGPFFATFDDRTPNSYEFMAFRETVLSLISEKPLSLRDGASDRAGDALQRFRSRMENQEFGPYDSKRDTIFLKYPGSALLIPEICETFDTRLIYVVRSPDDIERTQQRRHWNQIYGREATATIYNHMFKVLVEESYPTMIVRYSELLASPKQIARALASFSEMMVGSKRLADAAGFIRWPVAESSDAHHSDGAPRRSGRAGV
jgi:hypothetical protein